MPSRMDQRFSYPTHRDVYRQPTTISTESPCDGDLLFKPASEPPVPMKGRQTYRMWKAMVQLDASPFTKSRLTTNPKILHFVPLEELDVGDFCMEGVDSLVHFLVTFLEAFFPGLEVTLEQCFDISKINPVTRFHKVTKKKQFLVTDIYTRLHQEMSIDRKEYILGLTWTDLYPSEDLNFALGEALYSHRCAIFSFGRYEPRTFKQDNIDGRLNNDDRVPCMSKSDSNAHESVKSDIVTGHDAGVLTGKDTVTESALKEIGDCGCAKSVRVADDCDKATHEGTVLKEVHVCVDEEHLEEEDSRGKLKRSETERSDSETAVEDRLEITGHLLWKLMRVSSHELCHLFGLSHCVFFSCAMNESKSAEEALTQPLFLCPICLRKVQKFLNFDLRSRYRALLDMCRRVEKSYPHERLAEMVRWYAGVLDFLSEDGGEL
ncbi:archaemetzincin-1-like [Diadema setosum]|uniref:archaemetzincin-1-like n=1 Tax=Diadema setosum TaxID=31175 RepID=UPI003B3B3A21